MTGHGVIPNWKLRVTNITNNSRYIPYTNNPVDRPPAIAHTRRPGVASTAAQDRGRCPIVKLTDDLVLAPRSEGSFTLTGHWKTPDGIVLATWAHDLFTRHPYPGTVSVYDNSDRLALEVATKGPRALGYQYGWRQKAVTPEAYPRLAAALRAYRGPVNPPGDGQKGPMPAVVTDCEQQMMFVVRLGELDDGSHGSLVIYDRLGDLAALALADADARRFQFVDGEGRLLATARAVDPPPPKALGPMRLGDILRGDFLQCQQAGCMVRYDIKYERGGYGNSSLLLDEDYRWVIATSMQLRSLYDGRAGWGPLSEYWSQRLLLLAGLALIGVFLCLLRGLHTLVYPGTRAVNRKNDFVYSTHPMGMAAAP